MATGFAVIARIMRTMIVSAMLIASGLATPASLLRGADRSDAQMAERTIVAVLSAPSRTNDIWPGYNLPSRTWAIFDAANAFVITSGAQPAAFTPRSIKGIPEEHASRVYWRSGTLPQMSGTVNTRYSLGDLRGTAVSTAADFERTVAFLYHEAFHSYQHERFVGDAAPGFTGIGGLTPEYAAHVETERRLLRHALTATGREREAIVRQVVAVRALRNRLVPAEVPAIEGRVERHEGIARYVEVRSVAIALGKPDRWPAERLSDQLEIPLRGLAGSPDERLIRRRAYATGAALGVLLDDREPAWKDRVERGEAPGDVLASSVRLADADVDPIGRQGLERAGYDKMLAETPAPWGTLAVMTNDEFLRLAPYRVVLDVAASARTPFTQRSTTRLSGPDRPQGIQRPEEGLTILLDLVRLTIDDPSGLQVIVTGRPVSADRRQAAEGSQVITILLDEMPRVNGKTLSDGFRAETAGLRITGNGIELTMTGEATVSVEGNTLRVAPKKRLLVSP